LTHFADRIAWLAILRAPWCGLTLTDLFILAGDNKDKTIWELMQDGTRIQALSKDGQQRLFKLRDVLQQAFTEQRRRTLRRWVESVWIQIGGPATLRDETELENTDTFLELLDEFDIGGDLKDREQFMEQVATLYAAADVQADDRLQIMTIHKAKGLEFDTVILPGLSRGNRADETSLLLWMENQHETHQDLLLAPVKEAGEMDSPIYNYIKRLDKEKQRYEAGRLLYVAATRAKMELHLIGTANTKEKNNELLLARPTSNSLLHQFWPVVQEEYERALNAYQPHGYQEDTGSVKISNQLRRLSSGWLLPDPPKSVQWQPIKYSDETGQVATGIEFEWARETIMHVGSVVHYCIQLIAEEGIETWNNERIQSLIPYYELALKRLGVLNKELDWASQHVQEALISLINDERGQWILNNGYEIQENEYTVSGLYKGKLINIIIDRTFVDEDGVRWVVDYKTSRHEGPDVETFLDQEQERYQAQLEKYGALIQSMDTRPVRLGLYFPLLKGWREWAYSKPHK
jgi:ATP-dependent exoDNAse (exonuclease V) beta subunit